MDTPLTEQPVDSIGSLAQRLLEMVERIRPDDLTDLAQMHAWSLALAESASSAEPLLAGPLRDRATTLARNVELLIIDEAGDAAAAFANIAGQAHQLAALVADPTAPLDEPARVLARKQAPAAPPQPLPPPPPPGETPFESVPLVIGAKEKEYIKSFVEEGSEHVQSIEAALLEVERAPTDTARIDDLFRPFHTIKGLAGFLNLRDINCLAHEAETLLDQARKGARPITSPVIDLIFDVADILKAQIGAIAQHMGDPPGQIVPQPPVADAIRRLRGVVSGRIRPEELATPQPSPTDRIGDILVSQKVVAKEVVDFAVDMQKASPAPQPTGEALTQLGVTTARQVDNALRTQREARSDAGAARTTSLADFSVRIDTAKLDALVDLVGELVIAQTLVAGNTDVAASARLLRDVGQVTKIVRDVQELAMSMRMVPIGPTFQKMERLVRDLCRKSGKRLELVISGQDTELDKNVIQQISDPLVHMIRNAADHGIESPEERAAHGKDPVGRVRLAAFHQGGNIVIEIEDDGKGLDPDMLKAKGVERGLVAPDAELTTEQAYALIFAPGFSTAQAITDVSGRGVGMDVVKRNVEQLRGKIEIRSRKGEGTTFSIHLPLTLAIIDGMVVRLGNERFVIPTINIEQALRPQPNQITTVRHRGEVLELRGRLLPLIQLGQLFGLAGHIDPTQAMVVVAQGQDDPAGIVVEELLGQQQVVIKSLGSRFERLPGISGAAILGDGRVGLILEMSGLRTAQKTALPKEQET